MIELAAFGVATFAALKTGESAANGGAGILSYGLVTYLVGVSVLMEIGGRFIALDIPIILVAIWMLSAMLGLVLTMYLGSEV